MNFTLQQLVNRVRELLEDLEIQKIYWDQFESFPSGSCGAASEVLCIILAQKGFQGWAYVSGERDEFPKTHAWLINGNLIIDITGDQFHTGLREWIHTAGSEYDPILTYELSDKPPICYTFSNAGGYERLMANQILKLL